MSVFKSWGHCGGCYHPSGEILPVGHT